MRLAPAEIPDGTALVYALVTKGRVRYVGQTTRPAKRQMAHALSTMAGCDFRMMEVRRVAVANALRVERQVITAFQRRGEAELNGQPKISSPFPIRFDAADLASLTAIKQQCGFSMSEIVRRAVRCAAPLFLSGEANISNFPPTTPDA